MRVYVVFGPSTNAFLSISVKTNLNVQNIILIYYPSLAFTYIFPYIKAAYIFAHNYVCYIIIVARTLHKGRMLWVPNECG